MKFFGFFAIVAVWFVSPLEGAARVRSELHTALMAGKSFVGKVRGPIGIHGTAPRLVVRPYPSLEKEVWVSYTGTPEEFADIIGGATFDGSSFSFLAAAKAKLAAQPTGAVMVGVPMGFPLVVRHRVGSCHITGNGDAISLFALDGASVLLDGNVGSCFTHINSGASVFVRGLNNKLETVVYDTGRLALVESKGIELSGDVLGDLAVIGGCLGFGKGFQLPGTLALDSSVEWDGTIPPGRGGPVSKLSPSEVGFVYEKLRALSRA